MAVPSLYGDTETAIEAKLVLLGDTGTGKSSLMQRYVNETFDNSLTATVGAGFANKRIVMGGIKIKLQIWDTAGQERFRCMAPMYYRGAAAAILVYDLTNTNSFHSVKGWIRELNDAASQDIDLRQVAIGIAGNKKDLEDQRAVSTADGEAYAKSIGAFFLETSAKANEGLDELFVGVCQRVLELKDQGGPHNTEGGTSKRLRTASRTGVTTPRGGLKDQSAASGPPSPTSITPPPIPKKRFCQI